MSAVTEERVVNLEKILADFIKHTNLSFMNVHNALLEQRQSFEVFKDEMLNFKDEMLHFKEEMKDFKEEMKTQTKQSNKKWGELSNRLGTLSEDFAAPNIPIIAREYFGCTEKSQDSMLRRKRLLNNNSETRKEFDVIFVYNDYIFYNETKSTARDHYVDGFADDIKVFFDYFPEYSGRKLIPIFSSLTIESGIVNKCSKYGIYAMALKGDTMDLLNYEVLSKQQS